MLKGFFEQGASAPCSFLKVTIYIMCPQNTKKLSFQYSYLKLEMEDVDVACLATEPDMRKFIEENYPEQYSAIFGPPVEYQPPGQNAVPPEQEEPPTDEKDTEETELLESSPSIPKNKDVKNLYRRIAEKTHPDKTGNNDYAEQFSDATTAYDENNIARLLDIAGALNIELSGLGAESIALLKNNINKLTEDISNMKKTTAWAWHGAENEETKRDIILNIFKYKGIKYEP